MEQLKDGLLISELRILELQALLQLLLDGIDSGHLDAAMLDRAREVAEEAP